MQIHEITRSHIQEGIVGDIKKIGSALAGKGALGNIGRGFVQGATGTYWNRSSNLDPEVLDQQTRKRARQLAQQWEKKIKSQPKPRAQASATNQDWRQDALKSTGAAFGQAPATPATRPAPGQMPASVAASAQGQKMMQAYGQPRGGIQGVKEAPEEYTTPSGIVVPGGTKTDPSSLGMVDFEQWADQQLTTQISGTQQTIDLDAIKKDPAIKAELDKVLPQIKKDPNSIAAVEQYFIIAMKAMQKAAETVREKEQPAPEATNPLSKILNDQQLQGLKNLAQNPQTAAFLKQALGLK